jgi:hypothetical protein
MPSASRGCAMPLAMRSCSPAPTPHIILLKRRAGERSHALARAARRVVDGTSAVIVVERREHLQCGDPRPRAGAERGGPAHRIVLVDQFGDFPTSELGDGVHPDEQGKQYCETYTQCQGGVEVTLCSLPNTGHILYQNSLGFNVPDEAWAMFKRQPMK